MTKSTITLDQTEPVAKACQVALKYAGTCGVRLELRRMLRELEPHVQDLAQEKQVLLAQYATKDADGQPLVSDGRVQFGDKETEVERLWQELIATEVTVEHNLKLADVADFPGDPALDALELLLI